MTAANPGGRRKHRTRETLAALLWTAVFVKLLVFDFDVALFDALAPHWRWLLSYKFVFVFAAFAASLLAVQLTKRWATWFFVVGYPVVVVWYLVRLAARNWPMLLAFLPVLYRAIKELPYTAGVYATAFIAALLLLLAQNFLALVSSIALLAAFLIWHLAARIRNMFRKNLFARLAIATRLASEKFVDAVFEDKEPAVPPKSSGTAIAHPPAYTTAYVVHSIAAAISTKVIVAARSNTFTAYLMLSWMYTFVLTILVYALIYWGIFRLEPAEYSNAAGVSFWRFLQLSIGFLSTAGGAVVQAVGPWSGFVASSELIVVPLLGVVFVTSLFTMAREKYREDAQDFGEAVEHLAAAIDAKLREVYHLTVVELEQTLEPENKQLIVFFRRVRGIVEE